MKNDAIKVQAYLIKPKIGDTLVVFVENKGGQLYGNWIYKPTDPVGVPGDQYAFRIKSFREGAVKTDPGLQS